MSAKLELTHYVPWFQGGELLCENRLRVSLDNARGRWCVAEATVFSSTGRPVATLGRVEVAEVFGGSTLEDVERKAEALYDLRGLL